jgi:hypothetical protein
MTLPRGHSAELNWQEGENEVEKTALLMQY